MNSSTNISIKETNIGGLSFPLGSTLKVEYLNGSKHRNGHWGKSQGFMDKFLGDLKYLVLFLYLFIITIVI